MENTLQKYSDYPALSFVNIKGFGVNLIPVQISIDQRFLIISTYYKLTPVIAIPELIDSYLGTQADLILQNKEVFKSLLKFISLEAKKEESRIQDSDPLLLIRAFMSLKMTHNFEDPNLVLEDADYQKALDVATDQDDLIKNMHYNMVNALKTTIS